MVSRVTDASHPQMPVNENLQCVRVHPKEAHVATKDSRTSLILPLLCTADDLEQRNGVQVLITGFLSSGVPEVQESCHLGHC